MKELEKNTQKAQHPECTRNEKDTVLFNDVLGQLEKISLAFEETKKNLSITHQNISLLYRELKSHKKAFYEPHPLMAKIVADLICNKHNHERDKKNLTAGLDEESLQCIMPVLNKYEYLANGGTVNAFLNDSAYETAAKKVQKEFYSNIKEINPHCYAYKNYKLPKNEFSSSVFLDEHGLSKIDKNLIKKDDIILDVGGFIADSVLLFRTLFPNNTIYSFEAAQTNFEYAKATLQLNSVSNVILEKLALGEEKGELYINEFNSSGSVTSNNKENSQAEICKSTTLDDYVQEHALQHIGLIKVDIEGSEQSFLRGALSVIKRDRPVLLLSIYHNYKDLMYIKPFVESLNLNYTFKIHKPADKLFGEILLICIPDK